MSFRYGSYASSPYATPKQDSDLGFTAPSWQSFHTRSPTSPRVLPVSGLANTMSGIAITSSPTLRNANEFQQAPGSPAHSSLGGAGAEAHAESSSLIEQQRAGGAYTHSGFASGSYYPEQSSMAGPSSMQDVGNAQQSSGSSLPGISALGGGDFYSSAAHSRNLSMGQQVEAAGNMLGSVSTPALSDSAAMSSDINPSSFGTPGSFASARRGLLGQSPARYARDLPPSQRGMQQGLRHGALCIHQTFPDTGDQGVPVTVLLSVKADWARDVGLLLTSEGRYGGGRSSNGSATSAQSRFSVCFGNAEVEARLDRSLSGTESPASNFASLDGGLASGQELDLTITAHSPSFMNAHWPSARVPIRLRLISDGEPVLDPMDPLGTTGIDVGEYVYWQISPRESLKRSGDMLEGAADHGALRRPASFPALGSAGNQQRSSPYAPNKATAITRTASGRRSGLGESLGLGRPSAAGPSQLGSRHPRGQFSVSSMGQFSEQGSMEDVKPSDSMSGGFNFSAASGQMSSGVAVSFDPMRRNSVHGGGSLADVARQTASSSSQPQSPQRSMATAMSQQQGTQDSPAPGTPLIGSDGLPQLMRASQIPAAGGPGSAGSETAASPPPPTARANLELHGNLNDMAVGWSTDEWRGGRRLVQFWRRQEGTTIHAMCKPILPTQYVPNSIVVSCIFREDKNECFITSVDAIYLLEALVASRFTVEEKNRIRRNLEGFRPLTISKSKRDERNAAFFSLIMSFPNPKPRNIEKDVKVFPWKVLAPALKKIIGKYSAAYDPSAGPSMPYVSTSGHMRDDSTGGSSGERSNPTPPTMRDARLAPDGGMGSVDTMVSGSSHSSYGTMPSSMGSSMAYSAPQPPAQRRDFAYNDFVVSPMAFNEQQLHQQQHEHQLPTVQSMPNMHGQASEQQHYDTQGALDFHPGPHDGFGGR